MNADKQQRLRELAVVMLRDAHGEDFTAEQAALLPAQIEEYQRLTEPQEILSLLDEIKRLKSPAMPNVFGASKCIACGEVHPGMSGLPCPKMTPTARGDGHD